MPLYDKQPCCNLIITESEPHFIKDSIWQHIHANISLHLHLDVFKYSKAMKYTDKGILLVFNTLKWLFFLSTSSSSLPHLFSFCFQSGAQPITLTNGIIHHQTPWNEQLIYTQGRRAFEFTAGERFKEAKRIQLADNKRMLVYLPSEKLHLSAKT